MAMVKLRTLLCLLLVLLTLTNLQSQSRANGRNDSP